MCLFMVFNVPPSPPQDGAEANCGSPLSKDYMKYIDDGTLRLGRCCCHCCCCNSSHCVFHHSVSLPSSITLSSFATTTGPPSDRSKQRLKTAASHPTGRPRTSASSRSLSSGRMKSDEARWRNPMLMERPAILCRVRKSWA